MFCVLLEVLCEMYYIFRISLAASVAGRTYVYRAGLEGLKSHTTHTHTVPVICQYIFFLPQTALQFQVWPSYNRSFTMLSGS
jgi:hypothetical protein